MRTRTKKLDPYHKKIFSWLKENPDMSASFVENWLKEKHSDLEVGNSTIRRYVSDLRDQYSIPKEVRVRTFEAVKELPMGRQLQVDWGEIILKDTKK